MAPQKTEATTAQRSGTRNYNKREVPEAPGTSPYVYSPLPDLNQEPHGNGWFGIIYRPPDVGSPKRTTAVRSTVELSGDRGKWTGLIFKALAC